MKLLKGKFGEGVLNVEELKEANLMFVAVCNDILDMGKINDTQVLSMISEATANTSMAVGLAVAYKVGVWLYFGRYAMQGGGR
ncbi:hypothetical protein LCGC14_0788680 [marine sediment metagenome]|uniref:Uncharacterized protein n=1 Tax=marine sediment metagenome TaxID=412755 RepID=A0A0F9QD21_9ZZZZ